jgi:FtsP/CotA-like multicopper oxidase with cupredoxin domain
MPPAIRHLLVSVLALLLVMAVAWIGWLWNDSRLPDTYSVMEFGVADFGGGNAPASAGQALHHVAGGVSVADLRGPTGTPDERFTLTAESATVRLASGRTIDALTFDGQVPGPELHVREGDLVQVTLVNRDIAGGVTIHWHGVDVPNADDGVAGVT